MNSAIGFIVESISTLRRKASRSNGTVTGESNGIMVVH